MAGTVGGFVGTALNTPCKLRSCLVSVALMSDELIILVDVVKTRIQLHGTGEWTYPALLRLMREEGISGMYKGEQSGSKSYRSTRVTVQNTADHQVSRPRCYVLLLEEVSCCSVSLSILPHRQH